MSPAAWTSEVRRQALVAVEIASTRRDEAQHALGYYVRAALAHGLTVAEVCQAGDLDPAEVETLSAVR